MSTDIIDKANNNFNVQGHMTIKSDSMNLFWGSDNRGFQNKSRAEIIKDLNKWAINKSEREPEFIKLMLALLNQDDLQVKLGSKILA